MSMLWFEEFEVGREYVSGWRRITEGEIEGFAALTGDRNALHLDDGAAAAAGFGGRIAHGVLGLGVATGLVSQLGLSRGTLVALLGVRWEFRRPVYAGDEVQARVRVASTRRTRRGDRGVVELRVELVNRGGEVVQEGELTELIRCRVVEAEVRA